MPELNPRFAAALRRAFDLGETDLRPIAAEERILIVPVGPVERTAASEARAAAIAAAIEAGIRVPQAPTESLPATSVLRPGDLLSVTFRFFNLQITRHADAAPTLARTAGSRSKTGYLVAEFGAQHLLEQVFFDSASSNPNTFREKDHDGNLVVSPTTSETPTYPVKAVLSRSSRLVFRVTDQTLSYTAEGLLAAMSSLPLNVAAHAEPYSPLFSWASIHAAILKATAQTPAAKQEILKERARAIAFQKPGRGAGMGAQILTPEQNAERAEHAAEAAAESTRVERPTRLTVAVRAESATNFARIARTALTVESRFGAASALAAAGERVDLVDARLKPPPFLLDRTPPAPHAPSSTETAIELPWRLQLSPHGGGAFAHSNTEVEHAGRVELWHSRLGTRADAAAVAAAAAKSAEHTENPPVLASGTTPAHTDIDESNSPSRTVRAIWARDFDAGAHTIASVTFPDSSFDLGKQNPFRASLTARDRMQFVHLSSNYHLKGTPRGWLPAPAQVQNLMLSTLGGWLDSRAEFADPATGKLPDDLSVEEWRHRATMGRDQYVKVVYQGYLLPFWHRASLVKVTERRVVTDKGGNPRATLFQRLYVVVKQPDRSFGQSGVREVDNRMPLRWVRILTSSTPPLAMPQTIASEAEGQLFTPMIATDDAPPKNTGGGPPPPAPTGTMPFHFHMIASDVDDHIIEFEGPLVFAEKTVFESKYPSPATAPGIVAKVNDAMPAYPLLGQRLAFAAPGDPDDTTLATESATFHVVLPATKAAIPTASPILQVAQVVIPAMSAFTGQATPQAVRHADAFAAHGFDTSLNHNQKELFLVLTTNKGDALPAATDGTRGVTMGFDQHGDRSGGFVSPSINVSALARRIGPVGGDLAKLATDASKFNVGGMFGLDKAKLFGILPLAELLPAEGGALPAFVTQSLNAVASVQAAVADTQKFINDVQSGSALDGAEAALKDAVSELEKQVKAFLDGIAAFASKPPSVAEITGIVKGLGTAAGTIREEIKGNKLPPKLQALLPRPALEQLDAVLGRIVDIAKDAADIAILIDNFFANLAVPEVITAKLNWQAELTEWPQDKSLKVFVPKGSKQLSLASEIQAPLKGGTPTVLVSCALPPFELVLMGETPFITVRVAVMEFSMRAGQKPDINVKLNESEKPGQRGIEFGGPLAFVELLREIIPFDGFSDPPYVEIETSGLKAGFDLAIPDMPLGIFALSNIHFGAELIVPFIGESLEFRFFFATREDPFRLQVSFFAGGGFFAITVTPAGLRVLEASLEFGAAVAMSFAVASGSLSVMAGIYFRLEIENSAEGDKQSVMLSGFFRARGELDVLGLISACVEIYLELSYRSVEQPAPLPAASKAVGKASISIEVSVAFVSFSVTVTCEKQFAGSATDPTFALMMGPYQDAAGVQLDPWSEYCRAFAPARQ